MASSEFLTDRRAIGARRLRDLIRSEILRFGRLGQRMESEDDLAKRYVVSRNTVRDALRLLQDEGIVERVQGAGTIIAVTKFISNLKAARSFDREHGGYHEILAIVEISAGPLVASMLEVQPKSPVYLFERRTIMAGTPVALWTSYLTPDVGEKLQQATPRLTGDYFEMLESLLGERVKGASLVLEAVITDSELNAVLSIPVGVPVMRLERTVFTESGRPVDYSFGTFRGDKIAFSTWQARPDPGDRSDPFSWPR